MEKITITQSMVENARDEDIIAFGVFNNSPDEVYLTSDDKARTKVRWVAVRGIIPDWAIYTEWLYTDEKYEEDISRHWSDTSIARMWDKLSLYRVDKICLLDDEARNSYRN